MATITSIGGYELPTLNTITDEKSPSSPDSSQQIKTTTNQIGGYDLPDEYGISVGEPSTLDKFKYGVALETMLLGDLYRIGASAINAIGPTTFEEEREKREKERREKILERFTWAKDGQYDNDAAVWGGRTATMLVDPVYLLMPWGRAAQAGKLIGKGGVALAGLGAGVGATDVSVREFARSGEITPLSIGIGATTGAVLSPAAMGVQRLLGKGLNKVFPNLFKDKKIKEAINETLDGNFKNKYNWNDKILNNVKNISQNKNITRLHHEINNQSNLYRDFILPQERLLDALSGVTNKFSTSVPLTPDKVTQIIGTIPGSKNLKFKSLGDKTLSTAPASKLKKIGKEIKDEISANISKFLKDEPRAYSNLQIEIVKQMHKNGGLTSAVARAIAVNVTKPALGAGGGAVFGTLFTDSDEGFRNFVLGGAAVGMTHRVLMRGGIRGIPKPVQIKFGNIMKGEYWVNLDRKLRIITSTTQQSKLSARGPVTEEFSALTFGRPADTVRLDWLGRVAKNQDEAIGLIGSGNSIEEASERQFAYFAGKAYNDTVKGSSMDLQSDALKIVRGDIASKYSQEARDLAGRINNYMDEFQTYYRDVGFMEKEILKNYFPRKYDFRIINKSEQSQEEFLEDLTTVFMNITKKASAKNKVLVGYKSNGKEIRLSKPIAKNILKPTEAEKAKAKEIAQGFLGSIEKDYSNPVIDYALKTEGKAIAGQLNTYNLKLPISDHIKYERVLKGSYKDVEQVLEKWMINDVGAVLTDLARTSVKSVEFARKFGMDGKGLRTFLLRLRDQYKTEGFKETNGYFSPEHKADVDSIRNAVNSLFNRYGRQGGPTAKNIGAVLSTMANFNMMDKVTIANIGDLIQPFQNSRFFVSAVQGMFQNVSKQMAIKHTQAAKVANRNAYFSADGSSSPFTLPSGQPGNFMSILGKSNEWFFKIIGLEAITNLSRRYAYNVGAIDAHKTAQRLARKFQGDSLNVRNIKDNSLLADINHLVKTGVIREPDANGNIRGLKEVVAFGQAKNLDDAMKNVSSQNLIDRVGLKAADRDAIIPQVGNRLLFTQHRDPVIRLMGQFSSWAMAKSAQTNAMISRVENAELRTAIGMLSSLAMFGAIQDLRDYLKYGEMTTVGELEKDPTKWLAMATQMSGNLGWLPTTVVNQVAGYGNQRPMEFFPAISVASHIADGVAGGASGILNKEDYDRAVRNFYEVLPAPTIRAILDRFGVPMVTYKKDYNFERQLRKNPFKADTFFKKGGLTNKIRKLFKAGELVTPVIKEKPQQKIKTEYQYDLNTEVDITNVSDKKELNKIIKEGPKVVQPIIKLKPNTKNYVEESKVYNYLINEKKLSTNQALGLMANIHGESGFRVDADEAGDGSEGIGLFQHTYPSRKEGLLNQVPNYRVDWKGQIDYTLSEQESKSYLQQDFKTADSAAKYFMLNNLRPREDVIEGRLKKHNIYLQNFAEKLNFRSGGAVVRQLLNGGGSTYNVNKPKYKSTNMASSSSSSNGGGSTAREKYIMSKNKPSVNTNKPPTEKVWDEDKIDDSTESVDYTSTPSTSDDGGVKEDLKKVYEDILEESTKPKRKKFKYGILSSDHDLFYKVGTNIPTQLNEVGDFYQEGVQVGGSIFKPLLASDGSFKDSAVVGTAGIGQDKGLMSKNIGADVGLKYVQGGTSLENPDLSAGIGYDVDENKAYAEVSKDIGTYSIPKTPFKLTPNIAVKYSEGGDWNINPNLEFSFKSGGLLDRKRS